MSTSCQSNNPLQRNGSDQISRQLAALSADYFQVDERSLADFILFAQAYSKNIRFYGEGASSDSSWQTFFEGDPSVPLATIANLPYQEFLDFNQSLRRFLQQGTNLSEAELAQYFALQLHLPLLLLNELGTNLQLLNEHEAIARKINQWALRQVQESVLLLRGFMLGAVSAPVSGFNDSPLDSNILLVNADNTSELLLLPRKIVERIGTDNWDELAEKIFQQFTLLDSASLSAVSALPSPYQQATDSYQQIYDALNYNLLSGAIEDLVTATKVIAEQAKLALQEVLLRDDHTPHYGLWLSFLKLYQKPQALLNQFTQRHLDFYYRDVLQIAPQAQQQERVALTFELAKKITEHKLSAGVQFKGGKDDDGVERLYQLERDFVINRGVITQLKAFHTELVANQVIPYAASKVDSLDGIALELDKESPDFSAFGPSHSASLANIGFAVADQQLLLSDGQRTININVNLSNSLNIPVASLFKAFLTVEEGWLTLSSSQLQVSKTANQLQFLIQLDGDQEAITAYSPDVHGNNFVTKLPVLRIELDASSGYFSQLNNVRFASIDLSVTVLGSRNFSLSNDFGILDTSKPFNPFGAQAKKNSHFIVGGGELFAKPLEFLELKPVWQEQIGLNSHFLAGVNGFTVSCNVEVLQQGKWQNLGINELQPFFIHASDEESKSAFFLLIIYLLSIGVKVEDFYDGNLSFTMRVFAAMFGQGLNISAPETLSEPSQDLFQENSKSGFVRFTLNDDFGHLIYPNELALSVMGKSDGFTHNLNADYQYDSEGLPKLPFTPLISEMLVNYQSETHAPEQLFHVYPFGVKQLTSVQYLLPQFNNQGELYIGLENLKPPQSIAMLFEGVDGSSNPLKNPTQLHWHYLVGDDWIGIDKNQVSDNSYALSGSGIISFELPSSANTEHAILPSGLHWLRLSVVNDIDAVVDLLAVHTQAAMAVMVDNNNAENVLNKPLPAASISKLLIPDTAVKSITQPLPAIDGKPAEATDSYDRRVSERLRHKDRAVAVWDYEQLVLQHFPEVYQVRCLNHTELCRNEQNLITAENGLKPGSVLVVPIPFIDPESAADPHRPYNRSQTLAAIDKFLRTRLSPFVFLEVQNPQIEEIKLQFDVAFMPDVIDSGFHSSLLNQALNQYLMPWAYAGNGSVSFGGQWHKSSLINFIEEQPYVDFVKDVLMLHRTDINSSDNSWLLQDKTTITASTAHSILVSHAQHRIELYVGGA